MTIPNASITPELLELDGERIGQFTLLRALARISDWRLSIEQTGYEDTEWRAFRCQGTINDREWHAVASAGSLIRLLTVVGAEDWRANV